MYFQTSSQQIKLNCTIGLFVCKVLHPLGTIDKFWYIEVICCANSALHVSSRARLNGAIIQRL